MQAHGKRPLVAWREFQQRAAGVAEIRRWFRHWPKANVGIVTGRISGLVVVDVDLCHGGPDSIAAAEAAHGPLPPTIEAATGGGGRHLYYSYCVRTSGRYSRLGVRGASASKSRSVSTSQACMSFLALRWLAMAIFRMAACSGETVR